MKDEAINAFCKSSLPCSKYFFAYDVFLFFLSFSVESQPMALPFDDQVLETAVDSDDPAQRGRRLDFRMKLGRRKDVGPFDEDDELVSDYYDDSGDD